MLLAVVVSRRRARWFWEREKAWSMGRLNEEAWGSGRVSSVCSVHDRHKLRLIEYHDHDWVDGGGGGGGSKEEGDEEGEQEEEEKVN
jgi:hypothetical protein